MTQQDRVPGRGRFLVLDGVDGCGKSTQAQRLTERLTLPDRSLPLHLRDPGSTALGEVLRRELLHSLEPLSPAVETLLFCAARRRMLEALIEPALAQGRDVICERLHPSTFAYQACGGGLDEQLVLELLEHWAGTPRPDCVVWLDLPLPLALARRGQARDRMEAKGAAFFERVAQGYARYAELCQRRTGAARVVRVDARGTPEEVTQRVLGAVGLG